MNALQNIHADSGETDYWTPPELIASVREFLGVIDLDPASSAKCNRESVKATRFFCAPEMTKIRSMITTFPEEGGIVKMLPVMKRRGKGALGKPWNANGVFLNHPFSKSESACPLFGCKKTSCRKRGYHIADDLLSNQDWTDYVSEEHRSGRAKQILWLTYAATSEKWFQPLLGRPGCFLFPRTNYVSPEGKVLPGVSKGSHLAYFGKNVPRFIACFDKHGTVKVAL